MALFCACFGALSFACSDTDEVIVTPHAEVLDFSQGGLSTASLRFLNGSYGAGCTTRSGPWSLALSASPGPMDYPALSVLTNDLGCQLSVTALVADALYVAAPPLSAGPSFASASPFTTTSGVASLVAGSGSAAFADGTGAAASFNAPSGVAVDAAGNVFVADSSNHRIRKITPAGVVTTLAGTGTQGLVNGAATAARFRSPHDVAVDAAGNVFVSDTGNHVIRKITPAGVVSTFVGSGTAAFADGTGAAASFRNPRGLAWDGSGNLLVADSSNHRIRRVTPAGVVTTVAGSGTQGLVNGAAATARFRLPYGVAVDGSGGIVVADLNNHCLRLISGGNVTTLAGTGTAGYADGVAASAAFSSPADVAVDGGGSVFVADQGNHRLRKVLGGVVVTLAGSGAAAYADGTGTGASFNALTGLTVDSAGNAFVADSGNHRIRRATTGVTTAFFGNARFSPASALLTLLVSADPQSSSSVATGAYSSTTGVSSSGAVLPPDYTHAVVGLAIQVDGSEIVTSVAGNLALTDGARPGTSYVIDSGSLPASPSFGACQAAYDAGSAVAIAGPSPSIPLTSFLPVGTNLGSTVIRTLLIRREESGVASFQTIRITFPSP